MSLTPLRFPRITDSLHGVHIWHGAKTYVTQNDMFVIRYEQALIKYGQDGWTVRFISSSVDDQVVREAFYENKLNEVVFPRRRDALAALEALVAGASANTPT